MACVRTDDELKEILTPDIYKHFIIIGNDESYWTLLKRFFQKGYLFDKDKVKQRLIWCTKGDTTFLEAYRRTGRILNITVVPENQHSPPTLLNWKTSPNVVIWSAILASSAIPGLLEGIELIAKMEDGSLQAFHFLGKTWRDGSFKSDIPTYGLYQLFNVKYTIVSQVNPHVVLFFYDSKGAIGCPTQHREGSGWRGGFILTTFENFLRLDMKKWLYLLRNLDMIPTMLGQDSSYLFLQKFDGTVTMRPVPVFSDYVYLFSDPNFETMKAKIQGGEKITWPVLLMIYNRLSIEQTISKFVKQYH